MSNLFKQNQKKKTFQLEITNTNIDGDVEQCGIQKDNVRHKHVEGVYLFQLNPDEISIKHKPMNKKIPTYRTWSCCCRSNL